MARALTLIKNVRSFQRTTPNGKQLHRSSGTLETLPEGMPIELGDYERMDYDHREQVVAPVLEKGFVMCWVIISELGMPEFLN